MQKYKLNFNFLHKEIVFFLILYISLLFGFFLSENSTGGAITDYYNQKNISIDFSNNFLQTFLNYDAYSSRHSPVLIIFLSFFEKMKFQDDIIRLLHLHLCLLLPLIFYKIIKEQNKKDNKYIAIILSGLVFLSPTFRSLSIWPDSRLIGLTVFSLSIFYFIKFLNTKKFIFVIFNIITCAASSYLSPNFSVFSFFFLVNFINYYGLINKKIFIIIILNILISIPALYYIFILDINFLNKSAAIGGLQKNDNIIFINIFNNILITFSLFFFYLIPFLFTKIIQIKESTKFNNILPSILIFLILAINFDYQYDLSGGGIFFKISYFFFKNNYLLLIISLISIILIFPLFKENKLNLLLFLLIIINNPQYTMYHKYFDPFLIITFFSIFLFKKNLKLVLSFKNIFFIYSFFLTFLILSIYKQFI